MAELRPQLLGDVRTEGPEQEDDGLDRLPEKDQALGGGDRVGGHGLERIERVDQLHDRADRGIEVKVVLDVLGHALDRLVDLAPERPTGFRRRSRNGGSPRAIRGAIGGTPRPPDLIKAGEGGAPDATEEPGGALDTVVVPLEILLGRRPAQLEEPTGLGAVPPTDRG